MSSFPKPLRVDPIAARHLPLDLVRALQLGSVTVFRRLAESLDSLDDAVDWAAADDADEALACLEIFAARLLAARDRVESLHADLTNWLAYQRAGEGKEAASE